MSKQSGAAISSRLIPPNAGAIARIHAMVSSFEFVFKQIGTAFTPPNCLNNIAFPSITGSPASGPILPKPKIALPSVITATVFAFIVTSYTSRLPSAIPLHTAPTPGVYTSAKSSRERTGVLGVTSILPCNFL